MTTSRVLVNRSARSLSAVALSLMMMLGTSMTASADEADAKRLLKAMSDYLAAQQAISFAYDASSRSSPRTNRSSHWRVRVT